MNRRDFLRSLAFTSLAPFIPAIAMSPKLDQLPFDEILSGKYPLFLALGNESGRVKSIARQPVVFAASGFGKFNSERISFGEVKESCTIDRAFLENEDGSIEIPIEFVFYPPITPNVGQTIYVSAGYTILCQ